MSGWTIRPFEHSVRSRTVPSVRTDDGITRTELRSRADGIVAELGRITAAWHAGTAPSRTELYALADDLGALRSALPREPTRPSADPPRLVG